jgi:hypothetical protein
MTTNLIFATGFSGHGVIHSPATGRGVAELILTGCHENSMAGCSVMQLAHILGVPPFSFIMARRRRWLAATKRLIFVSSGSDASEQRDATREVD